MVAFGMDYVPLQKGSVWLSSTLSPFQRGLCQNLILKGKVEPPESFSTSTSETPYRHMYCFLWETWSESNPQNLSLMLLGEREMKSLLSFNSVMRVFRCWRKTTPFHLFRRRNKVAKKLRERSQQKDECLSGLKYRS